MPSPLLREHKVKVLLIDDQPLIGEAVRRMLVGEEDVEFHYCRDPNQAIAEAHRIGPTVILQDLVMPDVDGLDLVRRYREDDRTRDVPLIVLSTKEEPTTKAEAFARGANDYLVKLPDRLEVLARIRYHSKGYISQIQRDEAFRALQESQKALANDVDEAARYVRSLLPEPMQKGPIRADWRYVPSGALGGDTFGYHAIDEDRFAFYLLDVVGHGVGPALLSVSVLNTIRTHSLPNCDFSDPGQVITGLNKAFQMTQQAEKYFTAWYGIYDATTSSIRYSGGGHPPVLVLPDGSSAATTLEATGPMIGAFEDLEFESAEYKLEGPSRAFLYSDGVFEIQLLDGTMWPFSEFVTTISRPPDPVAPDMDRLIKHIREISGKDGYEDDFSLVELRFGA